MLCCFPICSKLKLSDCGIDQWTLPAHSIKIRSQEIWSGLLCRLAKKVNQTTATYVCTIKKEKKNRNYMSFACNQWLFYSWIIISLISPIKLIISGSQSPYNRNYLKTIIDNKWDIQCLLWFTLQELHIAAGSRYLVIQGGTNDCNPPPNDHHYKQMDEHLFLTEIES